MNRALLTLLIAGTLSATGGAQRSDLIVETPPSLEPVARRIREMDPMPLARGLQAAGLPVPARARIVLVAADDPITRRIPEWIVGFASGTEDVVIFPGRIGSYPYGSIESVVRAAGHRLIADRLYALIQQNRDRLLDNGPARVRAAR